MSKKLRTDEITSELASGSVFFRSPEPAAEPDELSEVPAASPLLRPARRRASSRASNPGSTVASQVASSPASTSDSSRASSLDSTRASTIDSTAESTGASKQASSTDSTPANSLASTLASSGDLVEAIYRVVKKPGKQTSYVRVTEREKTGLASILAEITEKHDYKVTETDLIRIATCTALADYAENGMDSMLMRVIVALRD